MANLFLDLAVVEEVPITQLALQKLVYFAHGLMLMRHGRPLVDGYFEAWDYGPVHPLLYATFKSAGRAPLTAPATRRDFRTGATMPIGIADDPVARAVVHEVFTTLARQPAGRLVTLSHAGGGPWSEVANKHGTRSGLGLRISDKVIRERFHRHLVAVGSLSERIGEALDESPPP